jgi:hypothetical protein
LRTIDRKGQAGRRTLDLRGLVLFDAVAFTDLSGRAVGYSENGHPPKRRSAITPVKSRCRKLGPERFCSCSSPPLAIASASLAPGTKMAPIQSCQKVPAPAVKLGGAPLPPEKMRTRGQEA